MAFSDVMKPVILNASTQLVVSTDYYLRDVCIVSLGDTNRSRGEVVSVTNSSYLYLFDSNVTSTNETYRKLTSFFMFASNKPVYVIELGSLEVVALASTYANLKEYLGTLRGTEGQTFSDEAWLKWLYTDYFEAIEDRGEYDSAIAFLGDSFNQDDYDTFYQEQVEAGTQASNTQASMTELRQFVESWEDPVSLDSSNDDYLLYLQTNNSSFKSLMTLTVLTEYAKTLEIGYTSEGYQTWLNEQGTTDESMVNAKILLLKEAIVEGNVKAYWYVVPNRFRSYDGFVTLVASYNGMNDGTYFVVEFDTSEDPSSSSSSFQKYGGTKSLIPVWDNCALSTISLGGCIAGRFASSIFDISASQKSSPFNYKTLSGVSFRSISSSLRTIITDCCMNFGGTLAGNSVLLNGRTADGRGIEYWYQWDLTAYYLDYNIISLLLNGINNPNNCLRYNQDGIDILQSKVEATLDSMITMGCLTEYGTSLYSTTNEVQNKNYVYAISYQDYISAYPEDYENGIYQGISFFARNGKYIRQIILSITIG